MIDVNPTRVELFNENQKGKTRVTWDLGPTLQGIGGSVQQNAFVTYTINGANETQFATGTKGSKLFRELELGNTYVFNLKNQLGDSVDTVEIKPVFGTNGRPTLKPRYRNVRVTKRRGTYAELKFETNFKTSPYVMLSESEPRNNTQSSTLSNPNEPAFNDGDVIFATMLVSQRGKSHTIRFNDLQPNTTYHYAIVSQVDKNGSVSYKRYYGTFTTLQRVVTLDFYQINMINDSDYDSEGDFHFSFYINKQYVRSINFPDNTFESGETRHIAITEKFILNDSDRVEIRVGGLDFDGSLPFTFDRLPRGDEFLTTTEDSNSGGEYTVAVKELTIPEGVENIHKRITLHAQPESARNRDRIIFGTSDVEFTVDGYFRVNHRETI